MSAETALYATCATGLQHILAEELKALGASNVSAAGAGVRFNGGVPMAYKACLWSRVANRVLLPIREGMAGDPDALYALTRLVDWSTHMDVEGTLAVDFFSANSNITHTQYGALKVKDAIVDQFRENLGSRPNVDRERPNLRVNVYVFRNKARIAIDLSGSGLHRRGYREQAGPAPVKENLAAALLLASGWDERVKDGDAFYDPLCGSGTLPIEAALIACNRAPGLARDYFGFLGWKQHDSSLWQELLTDAESKVITSPVPISGADKSKKSIALAAENAMTAGVADSIDFSAIDFFHNNAVSVAGSGLILTNPPYGERLDTNAGFYKTLGAQLSSTFASWSCGVFTATAAPMRHMQLPLTSALDVRNGGIDCKLYLGNVPSVSKNAARGKMTGATSAASDSHALASRAPALSTSRLGTDSVDVMPFRNRLKKNLNKLKSWRKREQIDALRVYDADLPEFAVAIDVYDCENARHVVVQEYKAPATVNVAMAAARLQSVVSAMPDSLDVDPNNVHVKVREKQSGGTQYERANGKSVTGVVRESGYLLECNFSDYLDTGLFLDHRVVRKYMQDSASSKRVLNLFAYTGAATIAAISGGAASTVSVDLSKKYCAWLERNLRLNDMMGAEHSVVREDVLTWLSDYNGPSFDLILLDPPTFSNSTGIDADWNVQRDHIDCIQRCMAKLSPDGLLIFSNNYRRFKLDASLDGNLGRQENGTAARFHVEDKSRWSIDKDFERNSRIHQCWFIRRVDEQV